MLPEIKVAVAASVTLYLILVKYTGADDIPVFFRVPASKAAGTVTLSEFPLVPRKSADHDVKFFVVWIEGPVLFLGIFPRPIENF